MLSDENVKQLEILSIMADKLSSSKTATNDKEIKRFQKNLTSTIMGVRSQNRLYKRIL